MNIKLEPSGLTKLNLNGQPQLAMHAEIESGLFPYADLGWSKPQAGDSVALKGDWIVDCAHPGKPTPHVSTDPHLEGYGSEIHPPTFLAFARASGKSTDSIAIVNPYRPTQLYNGTGDGNLAQKFDDYRRFTDGGTGTFAASLDGELHDSTQHIGIHQLIQATDFNALGWRVCAQGPANFGRFAYSYRFTARTGVVIQVVPDPKTGCVMFNAVQTSDYNPASQQRQNVEWTWEDINQMVKDVGIIDSNGQPYDVKAKITRSIDAGCESYHLKGWACLQRYKLLHNPYIDRYQPLHTRPDAANPLLPSERVIINGADDQPFPFYGRVHVEWLPPPVKNAVPSSTP
jgi:hypothetical protein